MHRFISFFLLSVLCLTSLLGNAGFHALGLHACSRCSQETACTSASMLAHATPDCQDQCCPTNDDDSLHSFPPLSHQHSKQPTPKPSEECAACDFFNIVQTDATPVVVCDGHWTSVPTTLCPSNDILLSFEFSFQQAPRGPPALHLQECTG